MLRKIRLTLASFSFLLITLLFLDFTGTLHAWFGWLAKVQFLPAVLALNVGVIVLLVLLTALFGRMYCSVICPMGVFQDIMARIGRQGKKLPYTYSNPKTWLRYGVLAVFIVAMIVGVNAFVALLDPYGAYGRIANSLLMPLWQWGNNLLAVAAERMDSYAFYTTDVWLKSLPTLIVAAVTLIVVVVLAWRNGRTYCNTICPVGTVLGLVSRFSLFRITIDEEKCNKCSLCARNCKSACIDHEQFKVDNSRCVSCMNCIGKCKKDAIGYKFAYTRKKQTTNEGDKTQHIARKMDEGRKGFLTATAVLLASGVKSQIIEKATDIKVDGGLADIIDRKNPDRLTALTPPGSLSTRNMRSHCTACQLCVSACDNEVLRPSSSLNAFMQPQMSFERGYCRPECVKCAKVCPAGAIKPISKEDKSSIQIGHTVWVKANCLPIRDTQPCDNCARHCPTTAIVMVLSDPTDEKSLKIPVVNNEQCIGCGACENLCPARPFAAIYVEGHEMHKII